MKELVTGNVAAAYAATAAARANRGARGFGSGIYPISPQTELIEYLVAQPLEKGRVVRVESEHSAMAVCMGASLAGARAFTASSSNGLAYMAENVVAAAMLRLPIVMAAVNRSLGPPWNIWADHGDTFMLRDSGWLQLYCSGNQDVLDTLLMAFRIAEDPRVLLPAMVCLDAFVLSHTLTETELPDQALVDAYLPPLRLPHRLEPGVVRAVGTLLTPEDTMAHRREMAEAHERVPGVLAEAQEAFQATFGRRPVGAYREEGLEEAELALVCLGTMSQTARMACNALRHKGKAVGSLEVKLFRPFPDRMLREALADVKRVVVLDRDAAPGGGAVLWRNLKAALSTSGQVVLGYHVGVGGGDVTPESLEALVLDAWDRPESLDAPLWWEG